MDNELLVVINEKELRFKLKSQVIVLLEKLYGKNIFEIFQDLSFTSMQRIFWESLSNKDVVQDANNLMDTLLTKYTLIELGNDLLQQLAVKSGILKAKDMDEAEKDLSVEELKNENNSKVYLFKSGIYCTILIH